MFSAQSQQQQKNKIGMFFFYLSTLDTKLFGVNMIIFRAGSFSLAHCIASEAFILVNPANLPILTEQFSVKSHNFRVTFDPDEFPKE